MPSTRDSTPSSPSTITASVPTISTSSSGFSARQRTSSGAASAAAPSVRPKLTTLLPTALPSASACWPRAIACRLTASSGSEVPNATSTRPATNGDAPKRCARPEAPLTIESPPSASSTRPSTNKPIASSIALPLPSVRRFYAEVRHRVQQGRPRSPRPGRITPCSGGSDGVRPVRPALTTSRAAFDVVDLRRHADAPVADLAGRDRSRRPARRYRQRRP